MARKMMKKSIDSRIFRDTAISKKKINIDPTPYRGGIRL